MLQSQKFGSSSAQRKSRRTHAVDALRRCVSETLEQRVLFAIFTVDTVADSGVGSLRQAIIDANTAVGADTIEFGILDLGLPAVGVQTITPLTPLPTISDAVTIDGSTQNASPGPQIILDGSSSTGDGLVISAGLSTVTGLVINGWDWGIRLTTAGGNTIAGNFIGTNALGTTAVPNSSGGIFVQSGDNNEIGDFATIGNVISGNGSYGLRIDSVGNSVVNNVIGTTVTGLVALPNDNSGIRISSSGNTGNTIGGDDTSFQNIIAFNNGDGVEVTSGNGNRILSNSIHDNDNQGIDLGANGVSNNDTNDTDGGANRTQNFPELSGAFINDDGDLQISGVLRTASNVAGRNYRIEFFTGSAPAGNHGQGETPLTVVDVVDSPDANEEDDGSLTVTADVNGIVQFNAIVDAIDAPVGQHITATATDLASGDTSEFALNVIVGTAGDLTVTGDGVEIVDNDLTPITTDGTDFGNNDVGNAAINQTFVLTNDGDVPLVLPNLPGEVVIVADPNGGEGFGDFSIVSQPDDDLSVGENSNLVIGFAPSALGLRTALVRIISTDPDENPYEFLIQGTGSTKTVSIANTSVTEGNSGTNNAVFTVTLSSASLSNITINYATAAGTAIAGTDYNDVTGSVTFTAGQTTKTFNVPVIGETLFEANETFTATITAPVGVVPIAVATGGGTATGTINNDDAPPAATISDVQRVEGQFGNELFIFNVTLNQASALPANVSFTTANGTAVGDVDYVARTGTLSFAVGQTEASITIEVIGDRDVEANETFFVNLTATASAGVADGQGQATIINDDATVSITGPTVGGGVVVERAGNDVATFTVSLSQPSDEVISVDYATQDVTTTQNADYLPASGTLIFQPGETTKTVDVVVLADTITESVESFTMTLSKPVRVALNATPATVSIRDSTLPFVAVSPTAPFTFTDANGTPVTIGITKGGTAIVQFATTNGVGNPVGLIFDSASKGSVVSIQSAGGTSVGGVSINGPTKSFTGSETDITGDFSASNTLKSIVLQSATAGGTLSIERRGNVSISIGRVVNYNIDSSANIKTLTVGQWLDTDSTLDVLSAPALKTINCAGDFSAAIDTGTIGKFNVGGTLLGANVRPTVGIKSLIATAIQDSNILVGVNGDVSNSNISLPEDDSDFFNDAGYIKKLTTGSFSNTLIAANTLGTLALGSIDSVTATRTIGVAGDRLKSITGQTNQSAVVQSDLENPFAISEGDFVLRIY